jgi:hypothetical protein
MGLLGTTGLQEGRLRAPEEGIPDRQGFTVTLTIWRFVCANGGTMVEGRCDGRGYRKLESSLRFLTVPDRERV